MYDLLYKFLAFIQGMVGSWGVAMIIFTVLIRLALTPLDIKSRASMRRTTKLQPQIQALQKKYANDREKLNAKTAELYKKEHVNPLSSCLPLLLTWPILIIVFNAMRTAANQEMLKQVGQILNGKEPTLEPFLWIKNLWMPDNIFSKTLPELSTLKALKTDEWQRWFDGLAKTDIPAWLKTLVDGNGGKLSEGIIAEILERVNSSAIYQKAMPLNENLKVALVGWTVPYIYNGYLLLPVLSAVSQIVMTKITTGNQPQQPVQSGQPNTGKFMQWFFPIFSLWICLSATASFALYWVAGNLVSMAQTIVINKILDKREQANAPVTAEGSVK